jgi:hypothetical protein
MQIIEKYEPYLSLLEFDKDMSPLECDRRAEKCFFAQSLVLRDLHKSEYKNILRDDDLDTVKSELMLTVPSTFTNADSRKAWVHSRPSKRVAVEKLAESQIDVDFLKRALRLFENAQLYFANKAKR